MPMPNPEYDPDWEALHDHHRAKSKELEKEIKSLVRQDHELYRAGNKAYDTQERQALQEQKEALQKTASEHNDICKRCLTSYQHKTIQDAAKWVFKNFNPDMASIKTHTIHLVDFESFTTMDEISQAWHSANDASKRTEAEHTLNLPAGRPDGRNIFENTDNNKVTSARHTFRRPRPLTPMLVDMDGCEVLVTADQRDNEYYICFTQDSNMVKDDPTSGKGKLWVQYEIEALATTMYKRAGISQEEKTIYRFPSGAVTYGIKGMLARLANVFAISNPERQGAPSGQFHFYIHHPPEHGIPEQFLRADMDFKHGEFRNAKFHPYDVVPAVIQQIYKDMKIRTAPEKPHVTVGNPSLLPKPPET